ncbi:MAG: electron transport complex subunit RsxC [Eubacteriales bacterium]
MAYTFRGGVHVHEHKNTAQATVLPCTAPSLVFIPLCQHIGAPCRPIVSVGQAVCKGQKIGEVEQGLGCPVHSSVSGRVKELRTVGGIQQVVIENDGLNTLDPAIRKSGRVLSETDPAEIVACVREAGIVGMGGAAFPTYAKLQSSIGKVDTLLINAAECEPFITANHRLLLERPESVLRGAEILRHALGLSKALLAIEDNKPNAVAVFEGLSADRDDLEVRVMRTKYPQGDERQLVFALTGKEIPTGKLPFDVGCVIFNAETTAAVAAAFDDGMPLVERIVTVDGDCVAHPRNLLAPVGIPLSALVDCCGGLVREPKKLICGGPMMGVAQWDPHTPLLKATTAVLVFSADMYPSFKGPQACIHCGRCVAACPMHLMPNYIAAYACQGLYEEADTFGATPCIECGCCSYVCPAEVPIVQYIRVAKNALRAKRQQKGGGAQ